MSIRAVGGIEAGGEIHCTSDARLKELVDALSPQVSLAAIRKLRPLHFRWKPDTNKGGAVIAGFFAQEAAQAVPEAVSFSEGKHFKDEHLLNYNQIVTYNSSAIQALAQQNDALTAQVAELEATLSALIEKMNALSR